MNSLISVKLDSDDMLEMLMDEIRNQITNSFNPIAEELFTRFYTEQIAQERFTDKEFDPKTIVKKDLERYIIMSENDFKANGFSKDGEGYHLDNAVVDWYWGDHNNTTYYLFER